ncbi:branched-chain amino acid ABC transporter [Acinetobacter genomosp. 33YU]|nr:branched-chain amino acid ABC transporter [Acinetobacter genomosp. 33YU]
MDKSLWIAMALIAVGTFLMRALPLLWMSRRIADRHNENMIDNMPIWLSVMGPAMIAAMFGTSVIPATPSLMSWLATILGVSMTLLVWYWRRSLGIPVFAGVVVYGITVYLGG